MQRTPAVNTSRLVSTQSSIYYLTWQPSIRSGLSKPRMCAIIQPSGWLSKSYISGLVLPGEGLCHFLISTLLENYETAISRLGEEANFYGGFSYAYRSFWSISCIVGRVLAAGMGLLSAWAGSLLMSFHEDWVNPESISMLN